MARAPAALALLLLAPLVAGCTWFAPPPPQDRVHPALAPEVYVVPGLDLRLDTPYGNVRAQGDALAVPLRHAGEEVGAVYLGANTSYRADAIFQVRERTGLPGDLFVEAPLGDWQATRDRQGWRPATSEDLAAWGFNATRPVLERASRPMPSNFSPPLPEAWVLNGTVSGRILPANFSLAVDEGPFVFQRDAGGFVVVQNHTVIRWSETNRSIAVASGSLGSAEAKDPQLTRIEASWNEQNQVHVWLVSPPFRAPPATDLRIDEERTARILGVQLGDLAVISMVKYESREIRDNLVELRSANVTLRMAPP